MIEKIILDYLSENASVPVSMMRAEKPPKKYIILEKTGSRKMNKVVTSTFAIQSYAPTLYEAALLNEEVKSLMDEADTLTDVMAVKLSTDYNFTNTATKQPRYQAVFNITHY